MNLEEQQPLPEGKLWSPLTREEIERLATYNAEVMRGIEHTEIWKRQMARLQRQFDETYAQLAALREEEPALTPKAIENIKRLLRIK